MSAFDPLRWPRLALDLLLGLLFLGAALVWMRFTYAVDMSEQALEPRVVGEPK